MDCMKRFTLLVATGVLFLGGVTSTLFAQTPHNFAQWENEISAFEQMDRTNPPAKGGLLFIGSSTVRLWTSLGEDFRQYQTVRRGFGGSEILDCTHFADRIVFPYEPRMIFVRAGVNDIHNGKSAEQVFADFKEFAAAVHAKLPKTEVVFISLCPSPSRWTEASQYKTLDQLVERFASQTPGVKYIETYSMSLGSDGKPRPELFQSDRLHLNDVGYKILADLVRPYLSKQ